jgi:hypothetical protein
MLRKMYFIFSIIWIAICSSANEIGNANPNGKPSSFEEGYAQFGYKSVEEAVKEFEKHFSRDVKLPKNKLSISFTHQFGRFYEDKEYEINDFLEIQFVNEKSPDHHFKIDIRPVKNKIVVKDMGNQQMYTLQNGQKAIYFEHQLFNFLFFEKDNWQYMLGIDKKVSDQVTPDGLVEIANSID